AFLPDFKSSTSITLKSLSYFFAIIQIYYLWTQLIRLNKCRHSSLSVLEKSKFALPKTPSKR
ncbi:hypothetical protein LVK10_11720, partial [Tenacibaculum maritimum]|uniref:hypothetical protein n=1 Tax=Tenacibaculum maritimum TaxID=107401 RepID=UPI001E63EA9F